MVLIKIGGISIKSHSERIKKEIDDETAKARADENANDPSNGGTPGGEGESNPRT